VPDFLHADRHGGFNKRLVELRRHLATGSGLPTLVVTRFDRPCFTGAAARAGDPAAGPATSSPAEWLAEGHVTCSIPCLNGVCTHMVDVRLDTLPQDQPWSRVGRNLICTECGAPGAVNIVPNWHDRRGQAIPFSKDWKPWGG
jgi:hypothetical protein